MTIINKYTVKGILLLLAFATINLKANVSDESCQVETVYQLLANKKIAAEFEQIKTIPALSRALKSSGVIWLSDVNQLVWQTQTPIRSTMLINNNSVKQFDKRDNFTSQNDHPMVTRLSNMFLSVLTGDSAVLESVFAAKISCNLPQWTLQLTPKNTELSQIIETISLKGSASLEVIELMERRGDHTTINLINSTDFSTVNFEKYLEQ